MPTYEYLCKKCGQNVEAYQKFTDAPLKKHEGCGGELRKVFHANGVVFKGSGFYSTDSRKGSKATTASNGSQNGDSSSDTKKDSKETVSASKSSDSKSDTKSGDTKSD